MAEVSKNKQRLLVLLELFRRETDEDHPLSSGELCALLERHGYSADRKSIYRDIGALNEEGFEIISTKLPRSGFFLVKRDFELAEIRLLMDAVLSAPFITPKKTDELTQKLCGQLSRYQAQEVLSQVYVDQRNKFDNEEIYYNIDAINKAIASEKKVRFLYHHKVISGISAQNDEGREFLISPYALIWSNDKYYLAGNYEKYDSVGNYRLDRMKKVHITDEDIRPFCEVSAYKDHFDAADYLRKTFNMYSGEVQYVELLCKNSMLEVILDKLGDGLDFLSNDQTRFTVRARVYVSEGLIEWLLQYSDRVEVLSPESLREKMLQKIRALNEMYGISG